jgi:hypothetical protein
MLRILADAQVKRKTHGPRRACGRSCRSAWQQVTAGAAQTRQGQQQEQQQGSQAITINQTGQERHLCPHTIQAIEGYLLLIGRQAAAHSYLCFIHQLSVFSGTTGLTGACSWWLVFMMLEKLKHCKAPIRSPEPSGA